MTDISSAAKTFDLPTVLVEAIVLVESGGDPNAYNPEPRYAYFWDVHTNLPFRKLTNKEVDSKTPPPDFKCLAGDPDQEWWAQQASWGLMQIMGAVARENGFIEPFLPELADPGKNLYIGCKYLKKLKGRWYQQYGWPGVVAAYNAGMPRKGFSGSFLNQHYVDKVRAQLQKLGSDFNNL
jgi:soluble lytic murein transglycosylase-like protein